MDTAKPVVDLLVSSIRVFVFHYKVVDIHCEAQEGQTEHTQKHPKQLVHCWFV